MVNPFLEVRFRRWIVVLNVVVETFETILRFKIIQAIFKWILYVLSLEEDLVIATRTMHVAIEQRDHVIHHLLIAGKDDVRSAGVVGEALLLNGKTVSSAASLFFKNFAVLLQMRGDADPGQSAA